MKQNIQIQRTQIRKQITRKHVKCLLHFHVGNMRNFKNVTQTNTSNIISDYSYFSHIYHVIKFRAVFLSTISSFHLSQPFLYSLKLKPSGWTSKNSLNDLCEAFFPWNPSLSQWMYKNTKKRTHLSNRLIRQ